jgi:hypothetical protein
MQDIKQIAWALSLASARHQLDVPGEYVWAFPDSDRFDAVKVRARSIFSSGNSIKDPTVIDHVQGLDINRHLLDPWICKTFEERWPSWIQSSPHYQLNHLDLFAHTCYSQGSQESFLNFYFVNREKRFRIFRGEYWWHMQIWENLGLRWSYIEDDDIQTGDVCMVSFPFAMAGDQHPRYTWLVEQCQHRGVELLVDFIYLPNSMDQAVNVDLSPDCIRTVTFSLSKTFPVQCAKIAVRMSKDKIMDPMQVSNDENVANRLACGLGVDIMDAFAPDYMVNKYRHQQQHWCQQLGLTASKVVHFAFGQPYTDKTHWFSQFNEQHTRYNLGMLYENTELLKKLGLYD